MKITNKKKTMQVQQVQGKPGDILFSAKTTKGGELELLIKLSKGKFYWKGKEVKDVENVYDRFVAFLKYAETN